MAMEQMEEQNGKELTGLLSKGLVWIAQYSCCPPSHKSEHIYNPTQAVVATALLALATEDIEAFSVTHRIENLSYLQCHHIKSWLKDDHKFSKKVIVRCLTTLAWLVVEERLSPQSQFVAAVTGLEEKYELCGIFVQAVVLCAKRTWKVSQSKIGNEKKTLELKSASTQTCFEVTETFPELGTAHDLRNGDGVTPLEPAVNLNNREANIQRKTLLECAIERKSANTIDTLLKLSPDLKKNDKPISELLNIAVKRKRIRLVRTLLWHGFETHFLDEEGNAPLHIAAAYNYLRIVRLLISAGASVTQANAYGLHPLHLTTDPKIITHLLKKGAEVDAKTPAGDTALYLAVSKGNKEAVEALMSFGAKLDVINTSGLTPLLVALKSNNQQMIDLLTEGGVIEKFYYGNEPFLKATAKGRLETIMEESEEEENDNGDNNKAVSYLPELGAFNDSGDGNGLSPQELVVDINNDRPIHKAAAEGRLEDVMELLDGGEDVDTKGYGGYTALQYAAKYGHLNIVQSLLQRGADMNMGNNWNWTPLHHAAHYSHYNIAEFLIEVGADTQIVDNVYGKTPLSWSTCNFKIIKLFKSKGIYK